MINISESSYKDVFAIRFETELLTALFLPFNGAKLVSLIDNITGIELLAAAPGKKYKVLTADTDYIDGECSAFDDMFPTIDLYTPAAGSRAGVSYMDHGEVCRARFHYAFGDKKFDMTFKSDRLSYSYTKTVTGKNDGAIAIQYTIDNLSDEPFYYIWAAHCMLAAVEGGKIITPFPKGVPVEIMFDNNKEYGDRGDIIHVKERMLTSSSFSPDGNTYKYYFSETVPAGFVKYTNPKILRDFIIRFDNNKLPYLGIWINNGHFKTMYNVAPEICSAPYDSPDTAIKRGCGSMIRQKESFTFEILLFTEAHRNDKE